MAIKGLNAKSVLDVITSLVLVAAAVTVIYKNVGQPASSASRLQIPSKPLLLDEAVVRGDGSAKVVMFVYSDFQCPFCSRFAREVLPEIERRYVQNGRLAIAFRHLPLPNHPQAMNAAVGAECAGRQGRFWEMHDLLFAQKALDESSVGTLAHSLGIDVNAFNDCILDTSVSDRVNASVAEANEFGINGTPAFFIGRKDAAGKVQVSHALSGALPLAEFEKTVEAAMKDRSSESWRSWVPFLG